MFGNLTYNNKVVKPSLRPVEAIAGMYDTQTKNYEYAIDNYNKYQTALSSIPVDEILNTLFKELMTFLLKN